MLPEEKAPTFGGGRCWHQLNIHWQAANKLVETVARNAEELKLCVNIAVVDSGGHLAAFLRMPGSAFHSIDIAINKAYTAMSFGLATSQWGPIAETLSPLCKTGLLSQDRLMTCGVYKASAWFHSSTFNNRSCLLLKHVYIMHFSIYR